METPINTTKDPLSQEEFVKKRNNQFFASRQNQIKFNNLKAAEKRKAKSFVDLPLDQNRNILKKLLGNKKEITLSRDYLLGAGYNLNFYNCIKVVEGKNIACVYEFGILKFENNNFKIFNYGTNT